jgi:hypothetical protein
MSARASRRTADDMIAQLRSAPPSSATHRTFDRAGNAFPCAGNAIMVFRNTALSFVAGSSAQATEGCNAPIAPITEQKHS